MVTREDHEKASNDVFIYKSLPPSQGYPGPPEDHQVTRGRGGDIGGRASEISVSKPTHDAVRPL